MIASYKMRRKFDGYSIQICYLINRIDRIVCLYAHMWVINWYTESHIPQKMKKKNKTEEKRSESIPIDSFEF